MTTTDNLTARLQEIRARAEDRTLKPSQYGYLDQIEATRKSANDVPTLLAALEAVVAVHVPRVRHEGWDNCEFCDPHDTCSGCGKSWPCPTITAITDAMGAGRSSKVAPSSSKTWSSRDYSGMCDTCQYYLETVLQEQALQEQYERDMQEELYQLYLLEQEEDDA